MNHRTRVGAAGAVTVVALVWLAVGAWGGGSDSPTEVDAVGSVPDAPAPTAPTGSDGAGGEAPPSTTTTTLPAAPDPAGVTLPPGAIGEFRTDTGAGAVAGTGPVRSYDVEVESATGVDPVRFADAVEAILADPRSWIGDGSVGFQRVPSGGSFTVTLATPATTDQLCAPLNTIGQLSCRQGARVIINLDRWLGGTPDWDGTVTDYRAMVINHEVGHVLGHGHVECPGAGQLAPVMMQQTLGLDGCLGNPWVFPGP